MTDNEWISEKHIQGVYAPSMDKFLQMFWVYSSIIEPQIVGDTLAQLLCVIPVKTDQNSMISLVFDSPIFCKVAQNYIATIDILITIHLVMFPFSLMTMKLY